MKQRAYDICAAISKDAYGWGCSCQAARRDPCEAMRVLAARRSSIDDIVQQERDRVEANRDLASSGQNESRKGMAHKPKHSKAALRAGLDWQKP